VPAAADQCPEELHAAFLSPRAGAGCPSTASLITAARPEIPMWVSEMSCYSWAASF